VNNLRLSFGNNADKFKTVVTVPSLMIRRETNMTLELTGLGWARQLFHVLEALWGNTILWPKNKSQQSRFGSVNITQKTSIGYYQTSHV